uniref:Uncharacterized protein n=1 Tax=Anguilla anguilla TaxID=7936 RepID=A0A0E9VG69_ANGAN
MLHESSSPSSRLLPSQNSQAAQMLLEIWEDAGVPGGHKSGMTCMTVTKKNSYSNRWLFMFKTSEHQSQILF